MIKILELFGGIGAPRKALLNLGYPHKAIDYVEIDEKSVRTYNALLEQKHQNDDWWSELDFWLNKRKTESKQIDIDRVLNFIEDLKR